MARRRKAHYNTPTTGQFLQNSEIIYVTVYISFLCFVVPAKHQGMEVRKNKQNILRNREEINIDKHKQFNYNNNKLSIYQ